MEPHRAAAGEHLLDAAAGGRVRAFAAAAAHTTAWGPPPEVTGLYERLTDAEHARGLAGARGAMRRLRRQRLVVRAESAAIKLLDRWWARRGAR